MTIPEITTEEYQQRRSQFAMRIGAHSIAIIPAAVELYRNADVTHSFRQNSDFYYLSGFNEPDAVLIIIGGDAGEDILFCHPYDPHYEIWNGRRAGVEGAIDTYRFARAYPIAELNKRLLELCRGKERIYYPLGRHTHSDQWMLHTIKEMYQNHRAGFHYPEQIYLPNHILHDMRLHKSHAEIAVMRYAAAVSIDAHLCAMRNCHPGGSEHDLSTDLIHQFHLGGATHPAYGSIVAAGSNACILHYNDNCATIADGDLVLIDAGCEIDCYAADITRTFPANGRFTPRQRDIYSLVLQAQKDALAVIRPGKSWNDFHDSAVSSLSQGLLDLGLLQGSIEEVIDKKLYQQFYMHRTGHWLGLDVHDVGSYEHNGQWRHLEPGMVMTVEPGLYITENCSAVDAQWRGIGVRIEDNVLVTPEGNEVLTQALPKEIDEVEAACAAL